MYRNRSQIRSSCGSPSLQPLAACSTGVNGRSHTSVLEAGVIYRFREQGVAGLVCSGELDACWVRGTATGDVYLEARHVRLWLSCAGVECNCLGTDKVVSGSDAGRDFKVLAEYSDIFGWGELIVPVKARLPQFALRISVPHEAVVPVYPSSATLKKLACEPSAVFASLTLAM